MPDLVMRGGTLVTDTLTSADIAIEDGQIVAIGPELPGAADEIDARGLHVFPGMIDVHLHFNEPGRTEWEGAATGSRALAAGGGTLFFDMPLNSTPCTVNAREFDRKRAALEASSITDFALWGGLVPGNVPEMAELADRGVVGFKAFLCDSGLPEFPRADDLTLFEGLREAARLGLPVAVHAESQELTQACAQRRSMAEASATSWLRAPSSPSSKPSSAPRCWRAKPAPSCTSSTSVRAAEWHSRREARAAASTSPSKPARTTCSSPKRTWSGWARSRNARRRLREPAEQERLWTRTARRRRRHRRLGPFARAARNEDRAISGEPGAASPACSPLWRCCWIAAIIARGLPLERIAAAPGRRARPPLSHSSQGPPRRGHGRGSGAGRSGCDRCTLQPEDLMQRHRLQPVHRHDAFAARARAPSAAAKPSLQTEPSRRALKASSSGPPEPLMQHLGQTRSAHRADHLLQTPDTFVRAPLPGMHKATAIVHAAPAVGARFTQYTAEFEARTAHMAARATQRFLYVLEGEAEDRRRSCWRRGDYAYLPAGSGDGVVAAQRRARRRDREAISTARRNHRARTLHRPRERRCAHARSMGDDCARKSAA